MGALAQVKDEARDDKRTLNTLIDRVHVRPHDSDTCAHHLRTWASYCSQRPSQMAQVERDVVKGADEVV